MSSYQERLYLALNKATGNDGTFASAFSDLIATSPAPEILNGLTPRTKIHCITSSLEHLANSDQPPIAADKLWNPIVASYANILDEIARDHPEIFSIGKPQPDVPLKTKKLADKPKSNGVQDPKANSSKPKTKQKSVTYASVAGSDATVDRPNADVSSDTSASSEGGSPPPGGFTTKVPSKEDSQKIHLGLSSLKLQRGQSYFPGFCSSHACSFCHSLYSTLEITRCGPECHTVYPHALSELGWFPHAGRGLRKILNKRHRNGEAFDLKKSKPKPGTLQCLADWACSGDKIFRHPLPPRVGTSKRKSVEESPMETESLPSKNVKLGSLSEQELWSDQPDGDNWDTADISASVSSSN